MGRTTNKKRKNKSGPKAGAGSAANGSALVAPVNLHLVAEPEFYEAADSAGCPGSLKDHGDDGLPGLLLVLDDVRKLGDLVAWFAAGASEDSNAKLDFPASLSSTQRAEIHQLISSKYSEKLEAYSSGTGEARRITVCRKGCAPIRELSAEQESKVAVLYPLAKEAALSFTRDEIADVILQGQLPAALEELWQCSGKRLWLSQRLCNAAALGDLPTLQALVAEDASVLQESVKEPLQGGLPLQAAAVAGCVEALRALHAAGANLEGVDGSGQTALQAARRAEQCDAEAVLLQLGAVDPDADVMPVAADIDTAGDAEQEGEGAAALEDGPAMAAEVTAVEVAPEQAAAAAAPATEQEPFDTPAAVAAEAATTAEPAAVLITAGAGPEPHASEPLVDVAAAPETEVVVEAQVAAGPPRAEEEAALPERSEAVDRAAQEEAITGSSDAEAGAPAASTAAAACEQLRSSAVAATSCGSCHSAAAAPARAAEALDTVQCKGGMGGGGNAVGWCATTLGLQDKWLLIGTGMAVCSAAALLLYRRMR